MAEGTITKLFGDRSFFFIDNDYFCRYSDIDFSPIVFQKVSYEKTKNREGKLSAKNVKLLEGNLSIQKNNSELNTGSFFSNYLKEIDKGYFTSEDYIKIELILDDAKKLAELFARKKDLNKKSQVYNYYQMCKKIDGLYKVNKNFQNVETELPKLIPFLYSAKNRNTALISEEFLIFMETNIKMAIKNEKNFLKGFMPHFEALMGFYNNK